MEKDYDRLMEEKSMVSFMGSPAADPLWSENSFEGIWHDIVCPVHFAHRLLRRRPPPQKILNHI